MTNLKQSATYALKTASKKAIQKTAEATGDLTGNKTAVRITKFSKGSPKNNSETNEEEILIERFIPSELRSEIIDYLRWKEKHYWWSKLNIIM